MKPKTTLFLLLVASGILAFILFYEKDTRTTKEIEAGRRIIDIDRDEINYIRLKNDDGTTEIERKGADWKVTDPVEDFADFGAITRFFTSLETLVAATEINDRSPSEYGLADSKVRLKVRGEDEVRELVFGNDLPVEGAGYYVQYEDQPTIFVATGDLKQQVLAGSAAYREHRLSRVNVAEVETVELKTPHGTIAASKQSGDWELIAPIKARGDELRMQDFIAKIVTAPIQAFAAENVTNPGKFGLAEPTGTVTFGVEGRKEPVTVTVGTPVAGAKASDAEKLFATITSRNATFEMAPDFAATLAKVPNDLRDRHLVRLNPDIVDRVKLAAAGAPPVLLARDRENWMIEGEAVIPANSSAAISLLSGIGKMEVVEFVSDVASELAKYGLENPPFAITFSSFASGNTAESKAGENEIVTIRFGNSEGGNTFAYVEGEPYVLSVKESEVAQIPKAIGEWKSLRVFDLDPAKITKLEIRHTGHQPTTLARENGADWTSAEGEVDGIEVASLVNTLAKLHAIRWISDAEAAGFGEPTTTVTFDGGTLVIGEKNADGQWPSRVEGQPGTFLMSEPDHAAFMAELVRAAEEGGTGVPSATNPQ